MGRLGMAKTGRTYPTDNRLREGETVDELLGGRLWVIQERWGYRFSLDALLLANFVRMKSGASLLDLGTGSAVIPMLLCRRWDCPRSVGVEI